MTVRKSTGQTTTGQELKVGSLAELRWQKRIVIIFSDENNQVAARQENQLLAVREGLEDRDVIVLRFRGTAVDVLFGSIQVNFEANALRQSLSGPETGEFAMILVGKDGTEKLRAKTPVPAEELFTFIDSMPMRQAETRHAEK